MTIGVSQTTRILHLVHVLKEQGSREVGKTHVHATYTNPFDGGGGAPFIFISSKGIVKFGHTFTGAAYFTDAQITKILNGTIKAKGTQ